jgi:hypothetical protein
MPRKRHLQPGELWIRAGRYGDGQRSGDDHEADDAPNGVPHTRDIDAGRKGLERVLPRLRAIG